MRWSAVFVRVEEESKFVVCGLFVEPDEAHNAFLDVGSGDAYTAAADFPSVDDEIPEVADGFSRFLFEAFDVFGFGHGEHVVFWFPSVFRVVVAEEGEVIDPAEFEFVFWYEVEIVCELESELSEECVCFFPRVRDEHDGAARCCFC